MVCSDLLGNLDSYLSWFNTSQLFLSKQSDGFPTSHYGMTSHSQAHKKKNNTEA